MTDPLATPCIDPARGEVFAHSPLTREDDVAGLIARSRQAQAEWAALPLRGRLAACRRLRDHLLRDADAIAAVISRDNGKTRVDAMSTEVFPALMALAYYMKTAKEFLKPTALGRGNLLLINKRSRLLQHPYGVVGVISPWNYPFAIPFSDVLMGLLAGNGVILKAATETQAVGRKLAECFLEAGLPSGLFAYVNLPGATAGKAMLRGGVDKLFFTGSVAAGKMLMGLAAETLTPVVLELGGNDPMLVCADADCERAAAGAVWAGFQNCGQSCGGVERIYVHQDAYEPFMKALKRRVQALRIGLDDGFATDLGSMTRAAQRDKVEALVQDALGKGASLFAESRPHSVPAAGLFMPARVLADVNHTMRLMKEEVFGPLVGVMKVNDMDQALALANDNPLALTASVWSRSRSRGAALARRLQAGVVMVNDHLMSHGLAETPWGGWKESGIGWTHGKTGFQEMLRSQVIVQDYLPFAKRNMWWHPHDRRLYEGLRGALDVLYSHGFGRRLKGFMRLLKIVPRYFKK
jgi:succinate-semialdehyde dehydrogenase/glutarate-semialdehyde dehydrogenase